MTAEALSRSSELLPTASVGHRGLVEQQQFSVLNEAQQAAVIATGAKDLLAACRRNAKAELPWLIKQEPDHTISHKDIANRHVLGLLAAASATEHGVAGMKQFEKDWGDKSGYLLGQVESFLPALETEQAEALTNAGALTPYDVHVAERRARRYRKSLRNKDQKGEFTLRSGVEPESRLKNGAEIVTSAAAATGSWFATDAAAAAVAVPVYAADFHTLNTMPMSALVAAEVVSYGGLIASIGKNIGANIRLSRETGVSINPGFVAADTLAQTVGMDEKKSKIASITGQGAFELAKDSAWNVVLVGAVLADKMTIRDALIVSIFANMGGTLYEYSVAKGVEKMLDVRKKVYNRRHPFRSVSHEA